MSAYVEARLPGRFQLFSARYQRGWPGANLTFIRSEPDAARLELEAEPEPWRPFPLLAARSRSRYELRWLDGAGWGHHRFRQRLELAVPYKRFFAAVSDEVFLETGPGAFTENRLIPVSLGLRGENGWASLYYMRRSRRSGLEHVLGTALTLWR